MDWWYRYPYLLLPESFNRQVPVSFKLVTDTVNPKVTTMSFAIHICLVTQAVPSLCLRSSWHFRDVHHLLLVWCRPSVFFFFNIYYLSACIQLPKDFLPSIQVFNSGSPKLYDGHWLPKSREPSFNKSSLKGLMLLPLCVSMCVCPITDLFCIQV